MILFCKAEHFLPSLLYPLLFTFWETAFSVTLLVLEVWGSYASRCIFSIIINLKSLSSLTNFVENHDGWSHSTTAAATRNFSCTICWGWGLEKEYRLCLLPYLTFSLQKGFIFYAFFSFFIIIFFVIIKFDGDVRGEGKETFSDISYCICIYQFPRSNPNCSEFDIIWFIHYFKKHLWYV